MALPEPPVCSYEGSDYQTSFWEQGGREYEDRAEAIALKRLLPTTGQLLLELGAGAGRNTSRYSGFRRIVLLDFSLSQLAQAQARLGRAKRYIYVAADIYRLPFVDGLFDAATMVRVLHHMVDAPRALRQVRKALAPGATFILEFANKRNFKAILRYVLGKQAWSPFTQEPVEFAELNFDFHPRQVREWLERIDLKIERTLTVSHLRSRLLKRLVPVSILAGLDGLLQPTGALWQYTPSVFVRARTSGGESGNASTAADVPSIFKCPNCGGTGLMPALHRLDCQECGSQWGEADGIYDFRHPLRSDAAAQRPA